MSRSKTRSSELVAFPLPAGDHDSHHVGRLHKLLLQVGHETGVQSRGLGPERVQKLPEHEREPASEARK